MFRFVKQGLKWFLGNKNYIKLRIEIKRRKQRRRKTGRDPIDQFLDSYSRSKSPFHFVQIGASDGIFGDPIHTYIERDRWIGLLVEPIPAVFELLRFNYRRNKLLKFENCAVGREEGTVGFYTTPAKIFWDHYGSSQRSSLIPQSGYEKIQVRLLPFETLVKKHGLEKIQLIHTDTEGYDFEILKQIDFNKYQTEIILFEHIHLGQQLDVCYAHLKNLGFELIIGEQDTLAHRLQ
ncbi:MAG: FkbM family methyltransferase [Cyclobacteriaceae bacterium]|nr:FkbM family methyltransferase [Cyclobacteriaceae bacterium]